MDSTTTTIHPLLPPTLLYDRMILGLHNVHIPQEAVVSGTVARSDILVWRVRAGRPKEASKSLAGEVFCLELPSPQTVIISSAD